MARSRAFPGRPKLMDVAVSPSGTKIAFSTGAAIWVGTIGGGAVEITEQAGDVLDLTQFRYPTWSPDGRKLVFQAVREQRGISSPRLYRINRDGSSITQLHKFSNLSFQGRPDWSSLNKIVFVVMDDLWVINPDGSGKQALTTDNANYEEPSWSPDGTEIAVEHEVAGGPPFGTPGIAVLNGTTGAVLRSVTGNGPDLDYEYTSPTWSPDGNWIAFDGVIDGGDDYVNDIFKVPAAGGTATELHTSIAGTSESESPDWGLAP